MSERSPRARARAGARTLGASAAVPPAATSPRVRVDERIAQHPPRQKLDAERDALSHAMPGATRENVLEAALDQFLAERARRKGLTAKPQKPLRPSGSAHIPAHVRRDVWERDEAPPERHRHDPRARSGRAEAVRAPEIEPAPQRSTPSTARRPPGSAR